MFVFYKLEKIESWTYGKLPKKWTWVGAGSTQEPQFPREEQFSGPAETKGAAKEYLELYFTKLQKRGVVKRFKTRYSYLP